MQARFVVRSFAVSVASCARALAVVVALAAAACGEPPGSDSLEPAGQASLLLTSVPADVQCLRVTATGPGRTTVRELEADASGTLRATLTALPTGAVTFVADAFAAPCPDVSARTVPGWVSDPEVATIAIGRLASVELVMRRNGRARVTVTFDDDACSGDAGCGDGGRR